MTRPHVHRVVETNNKTYISNKKDVVLYKATPTNQKYRCILDRGIRKNDSDNAIQ